MQHTVLLVDDEPHILTGLQRALRKEPYTLLCATSANDALVLLQAKMVDVVVSDQDMPGMSGTAFLTQVHQTYPDTVRFMLTGKPTLDVAIQAINDGAISRFLTKPCNPVDLAVTIRQALERKELMAAASRLLGTVRDQSAEIAQLERVHPGITRVPRDAQGAIVAELDDMPIEELLDQMRREADKAEARRRESQMQERR